MTTAMTETCIVCKRPLGEHSWNTRDICNMFIGPDRVLRMTVEQEDAVYAAYLGVCVLKTMCGKAGLTMGADRASDLLKEMGEAFPFIGERVGLSALR